MWRKLVIIRLIVKEQKYIVCCMSTMEKYLLLKIPLIHMLFVKKKKSIIFAFVYVGTWLSLHAKVCRYLKSSEKHARRHEYSISGSGQPWVCTRNWYLVLWIRALLSRLPHVPSLVYYSFLDIFFPFNLSRTILVIWVMMVHRLSHLNA